MYYSTRRSTLKVNWSKIVEENVLLIKEQRCFFFFFFLTYCQLLKCKFFFVCAMWVWLKGMEPRACVLGKHSTIDFYH